MKKSKSSRDILSTPSRLNSLVNKSNFLTNLNRLVISLLPSPLDDHCMVANIRHGVLILRVDSANWGMQLRYLIPDLLMQLRTEQSTAQITSIEYKIRPREPRNTMLTKEKPALSNENKLLLAELKSVLEEKSD